MFVLDRGKGTSAGEAARLARGDGVKGLGGVAGLRSSEMYALAGMARGGGCGFCREPCSAGTCVSAIEEGGPGGRGGASMICMMNPLLFPEGWSMSNCGLIAFLVLPLRTGRLNDDVVGDICRALSEDIRADWSSISCAVNGLRGHELGLKKAMRGRMYTRL